MSSYYTCFFLKQGKSQCTSTGECNLKAACVGFLVVVVVVVVVFLVLEDDSLVNIPDFKLWKDRAHVIICGGVVVLKAI